MLKKEDIINFCNDQDYDIRKTNNGRWIDQKCTPDVVQVISSAIIDYCEVNNTNTFITSDIWMSDFASSEIIEIFKKPETGAYLSRNEYDKFFQQPMKMLSAANILAEEKIGGIIYFTVINQELLEHISLSERYALDFIIIYVEKVLKDSDLWQHFDQFFSNQTKDNFIRLKNQFINFEIKYTAIKKPLEPRRIFTKVINPLAYSRNSLGTKRGFISKDIITKDMLMYNRNNFRDIYGHKPKGMSRQQYMDENNITINRKVFDFQSVQARKILRKFNAENENGLSQFHEPNLINEEAYHMHHIFMSADYPEISGHVENIIALSPNQHLLKAHPHSTQAIDQEYQEAFLKVRTEDIRKYDMLLGLDNIYSYEKFIEVLAIGFEDESIRSIQDDYYNQAMIAINGYY